VAAILHLTGDAVMEDLINRIEQLTQSVEADERNIGVLSSGEQLAVALVLDRKHLLGAYTMLEAVERLGEWFRPALEAQRRRR
jgi:hypothetical protein